MSGREVPGGAAVGADARSRVLEEPVSPRRRRRLAEASDAWLAALYGAADGPARDVALVAVGGYGRRELSAGSDLDVLLLYRDGAASSSAIPAMADRLWYPIWDAGVRLDHSVRTIVESRRTANSDLRAMLGLLDARTIAGDPEVTAALVSSVLADWRALARTRLSELLESVRVRRERAGECAHLLEPDLKESYGGLRDVTVLRAIAASWVTDVPHATLAHHHDVLADARDGLHSVTARRGDRLVLEEQAPVAAALGLASDDDLLRQVSSAARAIAHASDIAWHRVGRVLRSRVRRIGSDRTPLVEGVVMQDGEVVLAADARPERDPVLVLRAAAAAAQVAAPLAPHAVERLAAESAPMPVPWPREARDALVSLLGAGRPCVTVWEALDQAGVITGLIPEWDVVRSAPQRNPVHTFTVDRHLVETAVAAASRTRRVARPDLLLVGGLLHDIGKARGGDHTLVGVDLVERIGPHLGFDADDTAVLVDLVRHHLLLPDTAVRRDLDDPATVATVAAAVRTPERLALLHALTESDAEATGPAAWSPWKAALVSELVARTESALAGVVPTPAPTIARQVRERVGGEGIEVVVDAGEPMSVITVAAPDRVGLLGTLAGVLAIHRLDVRAADTETVAGRAVTVWRVVPQYGDLPAVDLLRDDVRRALEGTLAVAERLARRAATARPPRRVAPPWVEFMPEASSRASVLEVRAQDSPGLLHLLGRVLADQGVSIRAARVSTLGSEVVDAFYLVEADSELPLSADRQLLVRAAVRQVLPGAP